MATPRPPGDASDSRCAAISSVFCVFDVAEGQLSRERFFFDGAELAQQLDLAPTAFSDALAAATA
jgi:hypothetical protein